MPKAPARSVLASILARRPVVLGGACGTELERRGVATPLPGWSAVALETAPDVVRDVHRDHAAAGADLVTANTFRTNRRSVAAAGLRGTPRDLTRLAVRLAREGVDAARAGSDGPPRPVLVAGSVAPVEDCYRPDLVPDDATLRTEHGIHVGNLIAAGADLALVETMNTVREAVAAAGACAAGGLDAAVSFVCAPGARLLSGEPLEDAVAAVLPMRPLAVLVNCCRVETADEAVASLAVAARGTPFGAYANGIGRPGGARGWDFADPGAEVPAYLASVARWRALGATWLGGCCGTTPEYVAAIRRTLSDL